MKHKILLLLALTASNYLIMPVTASENTVLNQITRRVVSGDHFSSKSESETTGTLEGQAWYLLNSSAAGTQAINRLYRNTYPYDHMNSISTSEGTYSLEHYLGYAYTSVGDGLAPIERWYHSGNVDHLTIFPGENPGAYGHSYETTLGYGFPRFGQDCEVNYSVSAGGVTLKANKVAGGTISELIWNGKQFINNYDYGRQIQTAFNFTSVGEEDNPNEGGSKWGCPGLVDAEYAQGSPIYYVTSSGSTLYTKTRPLQWNPQNFTGGGTDNPVMWNGTIEKEVALDYFNGAYDAHVIKWTTTIDIQSYSDYFDWELFTAYTTDDFYKQYAYDAEFDVLYDKTAVVPNNTCIDGTGQNVRPNAGGVINATGNGSYAIGAYRKKGGGLNQFAICKYENGQGSGKYGGDATKWAVMERDGVLEIYPGEYSGSAYIIVGTLADVESTMRELYLDGY
jgi:hypothetical protein